MASVVSAAASLEVVVPQEAGKQPMDCPRCRKSSFERTGLKSFRVALDRCSACKGLWFDRGELALALGPEARELEIQKVARRSKRRCPRCVKPMGAFYFPNTMVRIEACRRCTGVWLDGGELVELKQLLTQQRIERAEQSAAEPTGTKAALLRFVNNWITALAFW